MGPSQGSAWARLLAGYPWFQGAGRFPLPAYSEFMPPPRLGRSPYGPIYAESFAQDDPFGWPISEIEQLYELEPGLIDIAQQVLGQLVELGRGLAAHQIAGYKRRNLDGNPYWPPQLAERAGHLDHERYVTLLPLALSRTQDDMGRVRWTVFGSSEHGPERAFWSSYYSAPGQELPERHAIAFVARVLRAAYGEQADSITELMQSGFRILPSVGNPRWPFWKVEPLPSWTRRFVLDEQSSFDDAKYLLTFTPFSALPTRVQEKYLAGKLHLVPFPGSLVFWGMPAYLRLQTQLPLALQLPLQRLLNRHGGPRGLRVRQSGWLQVPRAGQQEADVQAELLLNTYRRSNRSNRVRRFEDGVAKNARINEMTQTLFGTSLDEIGLYDKPMARNCQLWSEDATLLLDGPNASRRDIERAAETLLRGGIFRYRVLAPAMRVGVHEVYWQRPVAACLSHRSGDTKLIDDAPLGYLTAYPVDAMDLAKPVELFPRLLQRDNYLSALTDFESEHDYYAHQTALNILALLDASRDLPLVTSLARRLIRTDRDESLDEWLASLNEHTNRRASATRIRQVLESMVKPDPPLPDAITFEATATRAYEQAYWKDILTLSQGRYLTKNNADVVDDPATEKRVAHQRNDLDNLGDYLLARHRQAIADAGMATRAVAGDMPFCWQTDFDFPALGGWKSNQQGHARERNILVVIPGKNRRESVVLGDHYDTAYMEDSYEKSRGGSGARLAAAGADDNASATATLLLAAPVFLNLARQGKLERDVWLLHLTGEEFPADCLGARSLCQGLVEKTLKLRTGENAFVDLSPVRIVGVFVMDMIAHNDDRPRDTFQIAPGKSSESLQIAYQAHLANMIWNAKTREWNQRDERRERGRGKRSSDGVSIPDTAQHPVLTGEVRVPDNPLSSLYNTDCQIFSDIGAPVVLLMENYDIDRSGYHDTKDTMENIDLDYGAALSAIAIEATAPRGDIAMTHSRDGAGTRPDVIDWGIVGENAALRHINTGDPIDVARYWETNISIPAGLMVGDIDTLDELVANAKHNGTRDGFTFAISGIAGHETGEFQGFVQFTTDSDHELKNKIADTGLYVFSKDVALWEVSYAKYPPAAPRQVASAVRQGCVLLVRKLKTVGFYPRVAVIGCVNVNENPASAQVLTSACFEPIGADRHAPAGIIQYDATTTGLDAVWLLNWNVLNCRLREKAASFIAGT